MIIRILPKRNLQQAVAQALVRGESDDLDVLASIAKQFPSAKFVRDDKGTDKFFSATTIGNAIEQKVDIR